MTLDTAASSDTRKNVRPRSQSKLKRGGKVRWSRTAAPTNGENLFKQITPRGARIVERAKTNTDQTPKEVIWGQEQGQAPLRAAQGEEAQGPDPVHLRAAQPLVLLDLMPKTLGFISSS